MQLDSKPTLGVHLHAGDAGRSGFSDNLRGYVGVNSCQLISSDWESKTYMKVQRHEVYNIRLNGLELLLVLQGPGDSRNRGNQIWLQLVSIGHQT